MGFWEFVGNFRFVTSGFTLIGLVVAAFMYREQSRHKERLKALGKASGDEAARIVSDVVTAYKIDTGDFTKERKFDLAREELERIAKRQEFGFRLSALVATLLAIIAIATIATKNEDQVKSILDRVRKGDGSERLAAVQDALTLNDRERLRLSSTIGKLLRRSEGVELCNLLLTSADLSEDGSVTHYIGEVDKDRYPMMYNPVCSGPQNPDFSGKKFLEIELIRPSIINGKFTDAVFQETPFRDERPDYTGRESSFCRISESSFYQSQIALGSFYGCNISSVSFNDSKISTTTFFRSTLDRVTFNGAKVEELKFVRGNLKHVDFRDLKPGSTAIFAFNPKGGHLRMDLGFAKSLDRWSSGFEEIECVTKSQAETCWDEISEDDPECSELSRNRTYIVASDGSLADCRKWATEVASG